MEYSFDRSKFTAAILAGGKNTRFGGRTKAKMLIKGRPLIENTIETLGLLFDDIIIITNNQDDFAEYKHVRMAGDIYHNIGPLGGLHSALKNSLRENIFLVAGDMPVISPGFIFKMSLNYIDSQYDVLIPRHKDHIEPLHAIYRRSIIEKLEIFLKQTDRLAIKDFLMDIETGYFQLNDIEKRNVFININTQDQLDEYNKI